MSCRGDVTDLDLSCSSHELNDTKGQPALLFVATHIVYFSLFVLYKYIPFFSFPAIPNHLTDTIFS
jgi:hypothetical protein